MLGRRSLVNSPSDPRAEWAKRRKNSSEIAPPPPPPPIEQIDNHPTTIPCDKCRLDILHTADRVVCRPCNHTLCSACAFKTHVKRGCKPFTCPITNCLQCYSTAFDYVNENGRENINNPAIGYDGYIMKHLPVDHVKKCHKAQLHESGNQAIAITVAIIDGIYKIDAKTSTFVLKRQEDKPVEVVNPNAALEEVGSIFAMMYDPLVSPSRNDWNLPVSKLSPKEYLEMHCHPQYRRLLDRALFALSTGNPSINYFEYLTGDKQSHQKQFLAAFVSADILLRNSMKTPGPLQLMLGELLYRQTTTKDFKNLMSALNLAPSRSYTLKSMGVDVLNRLKKGINVKCRDLVLLFFDNVGFKVIGRETSYDQWIAMNIVVVTEAALKKLGFYKDDDDIDGRISREPNHVWKEVLADLPITDDAKERLAQSIVGVQPEDHERLSSCVLENIRFALDFLPKLTTHPTSDNILPRFDRTVSRESRERVDEQMNSTRDLTTSDDDIALGDNLHLHRHSALIPREEIPTDVLDELGGQNIFRRVTDSVDDEEDDNSDDMDDHEDVTRPRINSQYTRNNSKVEVLHQDLAKTVTQEAILDYLHQFNVRQRELWNDGNHDPDEEPPLSFIFSGFGCDGQPAVAMRRILAADAKKGAARKYDDSFFVSFGGFHTVMKSLNASGEYFEELLKNVFSAWRNSWDKVRWILTPSDPRQRENEYSWYLLASYVVAAENLSKHLGRDVSSVEVNDFMLERAKEYPICALALLELRMGTVVKLMRNAEKLGPRGCVRTFLTAIRLIMPLFAVTHKKDYMYLCQDLLKWYHCASDAQRVIYECGDTVLTVPGGGDLHADILSGITAIGNRRNIDYFIRYSIGNNDDDDDDDDDGTRSDAILDLRKINVTVQGTAKNREEQVILHTSTIAREFTPPTAFKKRMILDRIIAMHEGEAAKSEGDKIELPVKMPTMSSKKPVLIEYLVKWRAKVFRKNPTLKDETIAMIDSTFASTSTKESRASLLSNTLFKLAENVREDVRYTEVVENQLT